MSEQISSERIAEIVRWHRDGEESFADIDELVAHIDAQADTIQRVRELHVPVRGYLMSGDICAECSCGDTETAHPCPTIRALDGGRV